MSDMKQDSYWRPTDNSKWQRTKFSWDLCIPPKPRLWI